MERKSSPRSKTTLPRRKPRSGAVAELDFNDERIPPRAGDPVDAEALALQLPRRRAQQAGLTGASVREDVTADDLAPETMIDEDGADPIVRRRRGPTDASLREVEPEELFGEPGADNP